MRRARNLVHWCHVYGRPLYVMDDPTELHVKALLLYWIVPNKWHIANQEVAAQLQERYDGMANRVIFDALHEAAAQVPERSLTHSLWGYLSRLALTPPG